MMRLRDIEQRLVPLARRRWGEEPRVLAWLDQDSNELVLELPDGVRLAGPAGESGALLVQACALLSQYLERLQPWALPPDEGTGDAKAQ